MDKGAAKAEGGTPAPRGVLKSADSSVYVCANTQQEAELLLIDCTCRIQLKFCQLLHNCSHKNHI